MTPDQIRRAYRKLCKSALSGDGYQPFGYDERTLRLTRPGFLAARDRLVNEQAVYNAGR